MSSATCLVCCQSFSRKDAFLRHHRQKHNGQETCAPPLPPPQHATAERSPPPPQCSEAPPPSPPPQCSEALPPPPPQCSGGPHPGVYFGAPRTHLGEKPLILQHPFTMMISGPTACGKTTFVKELLHRNNNRIQPIIQRIVWLYKRWQPLYTLVQRLVSLRVQFIQGIPGDLDDDNFFDPKINNLLVIDDLFSEAGKDKGITGLYTEGSHHKSLSVIGINQDVFGTKDPTQRRNCHYLVLFKNPVDSQAVMSLARQMYPGHSDLFMKAFSKATKDPYSYLLVDLKPFTQETERLKFKVVWKDENDSLLTNQEQDMPPMTIKEDTTLATNHSSAAFQNVHVDAEQQDMSDKMNSCDDCGLLFDTVHDVQRHVKQGWCAESQV